MARQLHHVTHHTVVCVCNVAEGPDVWSFATMDAAHFFIATEQVKLDIETEVTAQERLNILALIEAKQYAAAIDAFNEAISADDWQGRYEFHETPVHAAPAPSDAPQPCCPKCSNAEIEEIEVIETYHAYHPIQELRDDVLCIENALASSSPSEHFDDGAGDYRAHCRKCLHNDSPEAFRLPSPDVWDWV